MSRPRGALITMAVSVYTLSYGLAPQPARAQNSGYESPQEPWIQGHIMGGYSALSGSTSDYLHGGWIVDGGFSYWPQGGALGIRADLSYSAYGGDDHYFEPQVYGPGYNDGWGGVSSFAAGPVFRPHQYGWGRFYGLAQLSVSDVRLRPGSYGTGSDCGPFAFHCNSGYGEGTGNDYGVTKLGWNLGAGVEFPSYWGQSWFIETQWRRVQTPRSFDYWPVTVGIRF